MSANLSFSRATERRGRIIGHYATQGAETVWLVKWADLVTPSEVRSPLELADGDSVRLLPDGTLARIA